MLMRRFSLGGKDRNQGASVMIGKGRPQAEHPLNLDQPRPIMPNRGVRFWDNWGLDETMVAV